MISENSTLPCSEPLDLFIAYAWDMTQIAAGEQWEKDLQDAIDTASVAILLVSANFLASDFITNYQLPRLLLRAKDGGTLIIPLIIASCMFEGSLLDVFQPVNPPDRPLDRMQATEWGQTLVDLAKVIRERFALAIT